MERPLHDPSLPPHDEMLATGIRHFFHIGWIHAGSPFETAAWLTPDESVALQMVLDDVAQLANIDEPFVSHTMGFMGEPDLATTAKALDQIIADRLPEGDLGIEGRLADTLAAPTAPSRGLADEIHTLSKKLRALGCAVVVFSPADLPEDMENRDNAFLDIADRLQDILVERGNEFLGDSFPEAFAIDEDEGDASADSNPAAEDADGDLEQHGQQI